MDYTQGGSVASTQIAKQAANQALDNHSGTYVREHLDRSESAVGYLHQMISGLEARLDVVLSPVGPEPARPSASRPPTQAGGGSVLAQRLDGMHSILAEAGFRLENLLRRIEV